MQVKRILAPLLFGLIGAAILVSLGNWQIRRLAWKEDVLARIEATMSGPVIPLPDAPDPDRHRYRPVAIDGTLEGDALRVLVSVKRQGAGYRLVSAFETDAGRRILVDRGFAPLEAVPDLSVRPASVSGNLHWPDDRNDSTPENDTTDNMWFARDVAQMAQALGTDPLMVVAAQIAPADPGVTPMPVDTSGIPNDHKQYALTWYSLAVVWLTMTGAWIWRRATGKD